ncbi:hypothetical protein ACP70R_043724 [Stipagrostis hirtigluma subsp. patula]
MAWKEGEEDLRLKLKTSERRGGRLKKKKKKKKWRERTRGSLSRSFPAFSLLPQLGFVLLFLFLSLLLVVFIKASWKDSEPFQCGVELIRSSKKQQLVVGGLKRSVQSSEIRAEPGKIPAMAAARIASTAVRAAFADEPAPPETLDVVRRQRQLLRRAAALCLDPIAEEADDLDAADAPCFGGRRAGCVSSGAGASSSAFAAGRPWASNAALRV